MATKKTSGYATEMRRCTGLARFRIEPHEAPVSTSPSSPAGRTAWHDLRARREGVREGRHGACHVAAAGPGRTSGALPRGCVPVGTLARERAEDGSWIGQRRDGSCERR
jgi:hypothetical protein